jgi:hypothetical protein
VTPHLDDGPSELVIAIAVDAATQVELAVGAYRAVLAGGVATGARERARELAYVGRAISRNLEQIAAELPESMTPVRAIEALRLLECAFIALAQDPVDERTLPSAAELDDALALGDVDGWLENMR